jgi:hypothetical protein
MALRPNLRIEREANAPHPARVVAGRVDELILTVTSASAAVYAGASLLTAAAGSPQ